MGTRSKTLTEGNILCPAHYFDYSCFSRSWPFSAPASYGQEVRLPSIQQTVAALKARSVIMPLAWRSLRQAPGNVSHLVTSQRTPWSGSRIRTWVWITMSGCSSGPTASRVIATMRAPRPPPRLGWSVGTGASILPSTPSATVAHPASWSAVFPAGLAPMPLSFSPTRARSIASSLQVSHLPPISVKRSQVYSSSSMSVPFRR